MADLVELEQWEAGVYQLETEDPVLGGAEGIDNLQAKQLANRTKYLKAMVELRALINSPAFTGIPTVPTPAPGTNTTQIVNAAFVQAAITALINSSPAALDTLNELSAALGNDADFATTITNALALKAPLASPVLTGDPKAPTPAPGDNDTSIATTAFVQAAIAALSNTGDYKASVRVASISAINLAAPGASIDGVAMVAGDRFLEKDNATLADRGIYIWNGAAVPATRALDADTGAEFNGGAIIPVEQGTVNADTNWQLTNDGTVTIGTTGLTFLNLNPRQTTLLSANGYRVLPAFPQDPNPLIIQWGRASNATAGQITITFPIAFPNAKYLEHAIPIVGSPIGWDVASSNGGISLSQAVFNRRAGNGTTTNSTTNFDVYWIAIGY